MSASAFLAVNARIRDRHNEAREQAWRDYSMAPPEQHPWSEQEPDVYKASWPLARRMEALRRVLAQPLRWARPLARRLARDAAALPRATKKLLRTPPTHDPAPASAPEPPPDPDPRERTPPRPQRAALSAAACG